MAHNNEFAETTDGLSSTYSLDQTVKKKRYFHFSYHCIKFSFTFFSVKQIKHLFNFLYSIQFFFQFQYTITTKPERLIPEKHVGRRIVAISQFKKKLLNFCNHGPLGCPPNDIILTGENRNGLISLLTFKCKMCNITFTIENDTCEDNYLNLNACAVAGTIAIGCGRSQLEEVL